MAVFVETAIAEGLLRHLRDNANPDGLPISYENKPFSEPAPYLASRVFPNRTVQATLGIAGMNRHTGFLQVNVVWPEGRTMRKPRETAGAIVSAFKRGTVIIEDGVIIRIDAPPYLSSTLQEGETATIPVTIPYLADTPNA